MTNQPEIKKYRRKVSEKKVREIKEKLSNKRGFQCVSCAVIAGVLEVNAEVVEITLEKDGKRYWANDCACHPKIQRCYPTLQQFNEEWEEVK